VREHRPGSWEEVEALRGGYGLITAVILYW